MHCLVFRLRPSCIHMGIGNNQGRLVVSTQNNGIPTGGGRCLGNLLGGAFIPPCVRNKRLSAPRAPDQLCPDRHYPNPQRTHEASRQTPHQRPDGHCTHAQQQRQFQEPECCSWQASSSLPAGCDADFCGSCHAQHWQDQVHGGACQRFQQPRHFQDASCHVRMQATPQEDYRRSRSRARQASAAMRSGSPRAVQTWDRRPSFSESHRLQRTSRSSSNSPWGYRAELLPHHQISSHRLCDMPACCKQI